MSIKIKSKIKVSKPKQKNNKSFLEILFSHKKKKQKKFHCLKEIKRRVIRVNNLKRELIELEFQKSQLTNDCYSNYTIKKIRDTESGILRKQNETEILKKQLNQIQNMFWLINPVGLQQQQQQLQQLQLQLQLQQQQRQQQKNKNEEEQLKSIIMEKIFVNQKQISLLENRFSFFQKKLENLKQTKKQEIEKTRKHLETQQGKQLIVEQDQNIKNFKKEIIRIEKRIKKISFELNNLKPLTSNFSQVRNKKDLLDIKTDKLTKENNLMRKKISDLLDGFDTTGYFQFFEKKGTKKASQERKTQNGNEKTTRTNIPNGKGKGKGTGQIRNQKSNKRKMQSVLIKKLKSSHSLDNILSSCENLNQLNSQKEMKKTESSKRSLSGNTNMNQNNKKILDLNKLFYEYGKSPKRILPKTKSTEDTMDRADNNKIVSTNLGLKNRFGKMKNFLNNNHILLNCTPRVGHLNLQFIQIKTLDNLLSIPLAVDYFKEFLAKQLNQENILFFEEVKDFKTQIRSYKRMKKKAKKIYLKYIKPGSLFEINIIFQCRQKITDQISQKQFSLIMFDEAQETVYRHLKRNSWQSFLQSGIYKELINNLQYDSNYNLNGNIKGCVLVYRMLKKNINKKNVEALNKEFIYKGKQNPAEMVGEELIMMLLDIINTNYNSRKEQIRVKQILKSIQFSRFLELSSQLQKVSFACLKNEDDKLRFWINLYNTMTLHCFLINGFPKDKTHYEKLLKNTKYLINQQYFSLNDIYHGILRCNNDPKHNNRNYFKTQQNNINDLMLQKIDTRIHFVCYHYSFPTFIQIYHKKNFQHSLEKVTKRVLNPLVKINQNKNKIQLPNIFSIYDKDFQSDGNILDWINSHINTKIKIEDKNSYTIKYYNKNISDQKIVFDHRETLFRKFMN
ncbi:electron carrier/ protein disulfide oxidoreductase [Anaeramoeba flamelloides]|uniref:Electron carrier/ protein disulfide oxidoreductase n=1 Tax=Anaeramoeba flamelloides TaxID=1746091 RepID=A0AAV7YYY2_9EUKA|nr:electron carrier/ protein disulfide oxidoreductase [Anaeramoeba flamelloides]